MFKASCIGDKDRNPFICLFYQLIGLTVVYAIFTAKIFICGAKRQPFSEDHCTKPIPDSAMAVAEYFFRYQAWVIVPG
jgi:hypothetical protein